MIDISKAVYGTSGVKQFTPKEGTLIIEEKVETVPSFTSPFYSDPPAVVGFFKDGDAYAVKFCNGAKISTVGSPCSAKTPEKRVLVMPLVKEQNPHICTDYISPVASTVLEPTSEEFVPAIPPIHMGGRKNACAFLHFLTDSAFENDGTLIILGGGTGKNYGPFLPYVKSKIYWCDPIAPMKSNLPTCVELVSDIFRFPDLSDYPRPFYIFSDVATEDFGSSPDDEVYSKVVIEDLKFHNKVYETYKPKLFDHKFRVPTVDYELYCGTIHSVPWGTLNEKRMRLFCGMHKVTFDVSEYRQACRQAVVKSRGLCAGPVFPFHDHCWNCVVESSTLVNFAEKYDIPIGWFGKKFSAIFRGRVADIISRPASDSELIKTTIPGISVTPGPLAESRYTVLREANDLLRPHIKDFGLSKTAIASTLFPDIHEKVLRAATRLSAGKTVVEVQSIMITKKYKMSLHAICNFKEADIYVVNSNIRLGVYVEGAFARLVLGAGHYARFSSTSWVGGVLSVLEPVKVGTELIVAYYQ